VHWSLIRLAFSSPARLAMLQLQDVLGLGDEARMNIPGRARGNWGWKLDRAMLTPARARTLRDVTAESGRIP
jgi:4-alpha-glucanotransferase